LHGFPVVVFCLQEGSIRTPVAKDVLQNDVIKRSMGPNVTGTAIEFAYAMALPHTKGKLVSAEVEATIAGALVPIWIIIPTTLRVVQMYL
jgi:hypothetical protein